MCSSETIILKEEKRSSIMAVQMNNLRSLIGTRRMCKVPNARIKELCEVTKGLMKMFSDGSAMWTEWRMIGSPRESM